MPTFTVELTRRYYVTDTVEIQADNADQAYTKAEANFDKLKRGVL